MVFLNVLLLLLVEHERFSSNVFQNNKNWFLVCKVGWNKLSKTTATASNRNSDKYLVIVGLIFTNGLLSFIICSSTNYNKNKVFESSKNIFYQFNFRLPYHKKWEKNLIQEYSCPPFHLFVPKYPPLMAFSREGKVFKLKVIQKEVFKFFCSNQELRSFM